MAQYKLFYAAGTCSMAVHVLLNELKQPFELSKVDFANRSPEFLKANPRGSVPVLVTPAGQVIREGGAILNWLCDTHSNNLMPANGAARATAMEWLAFANATVHPAYSTMFMLLKNGSDEQKTTQHAKIQKLWDEVEQKLSTSTYICGNTPTPADILLTVIANWNGYLPTPIKFGTNCKRLFSTMIARPAYQKALTTEQVEYKAAA